MSAQIWFHPHVEVMRHCGLLDEHTSWASGLQHYHLFLMWVKETPVFMKWSGPFIIHHQKIGDCLAYTITFLLMSIINNFFFIRTVTFEGFSVIYSTSCPFESLRLSLLWNIQNKLVPSKMKTCSPLTHPQATQDVGDFFYSVKVSKEGFHLKPWFCHS